MLRTITLSLALSLSLMAAALGQDAAPSLDETQKRLDGIEAELKLDLDDARLIDLRTRIEPIQAQMAEQITALQAAREAADRRLAEIAPPPAGEGQPAPTESPELVKQREDQQAARAAVEAEERRARLLAVRADQAAQATSDRRRALFTARIFDRSLSLLDPELWANGTQAVVTGAQRLTGVITFTINNAIQRNSLWQNLPALLGALALLFLAWPARHYMLAGAFKLVQWRTRNPKLRRSAFALATALVSTAVIGLAALGIGLVLETAGLLPGVLGTLALRFLGAITFVGLAHGLAIGLLAPNRPDMRLVPVSDLLAQRLHYFPLLTAGLFAAGKMTVAVGETFRVPLAGTILVSGLFAIATALAAAAALKILSASQEPQQDRSGQIGIALLRVVAWMIVGAALVAITVGYVQMAVFLVDQLVWVAMVGAVLYLLMHVIDDALMAWAQPAGLLGRFAISTVGVGGTALERVAVILSGVIRAMLIVVATLLVLAPWGVQSSDTLSALRGAVFGFEVGGLRISLSQLFAAIMLFTAGYAATRVVQGWLDRRLLPRTEMDSGLKSSIGTGVGYVGVIAASMAAFGYLGFSLDRIAVLAGALSLGIGFGLQSIVNNFVSGIILLAERPIKPGDWVAIGSDEGNVKRISVRSTEVALFDGSTLMVPNADLISKPVRNVTLRGTPGRVKLDFGVAHGSDVDKVKEVALAITAEHKSVLPTPDPIVQITGFRDLGVTFSLICHVASPRAVANTRSDLAFALVRGLQQAGITMG